MLTDEQMLQHLSSLNLTSAGIDYVMRVRASPPARSVQANVFLNSPVRYASQKMGCVIELESWTVERPVALELEFDKSVLEYWNQTIAVLINGYRKDGRRFRGQYVADLLAIKKDKVIAYEPKADETLRRLCRLRPQDWVTSDGTYRFMPAQRSFENFGIEHRVVSSAGLNQVRAENLNLLIHTRDVNSSPHELQLTQRAVRLLQKKRVASMCGIAALMEIHDFTPILRGIADGLIFADLSNCRLSVPEGVWLTAAPADLELVKSADLSYPGILLDFRAPTTGRAPAGKAAFALAEMIGQLQGSIAPIRSERTLRRYRQKLAESHGDVLALVRKRLEVERGHSQLCDDHEAFISRVIRQKFENAKNPNKAAAYRSYKKRFPRTKLPGMGETPVARNTFYKRILWRNPENAGYRRGGRRRANAERRPTPASLRGLSASRPFQKAHIDHYLCDAFAIVTRSDGAVYTAKPWLTLMVDECAGGVLAMSLGFKSPSTLACMSVLRDCALRHGRLPEVIMVDQGSEFRSVQFETCLAAFGVTKQERPSGAPKFGGNLETSFNVTRTQFFNEIDGNTAEGLEGRKRSSSHSPRSNAKHDLYGIYQRIESFFFKYYNGHPRGAALASPNKLLEDGLKRYPQSGIRVKFDELFLVRTAMPAPRKTYRVHRRRGIRIYGRDYWTPAFATFKARKIRDPRLEQWDDGIAYVAIKGRWHKAERRAAASVIGVPLAIRMCESTRFLEGRKQIMEAKHASDIALAKMHSKTSGHSARDSAKTRNKETYEDEGTNPVAHRAIKNPMPIEFGR